MARRDVSLQYTTEKTFDWGQLASARTRLRDPAPRLTRRRGHAAAALLPLKCSAKVATGRRVGRGCSGACGIETLHTSGRHY